MCVCVVLIACRSLMCKNPKLLKAMAESDNHSYTYTHVHQITVVINHSIRTINMWKNKTKLSCCVSFAFFLAMLMCKYVSSFRRQKFSHTDSDGRNARLPIHFRTSAQNMFMCVCVRACECNTAGNRATRLRYDCSTSAQKRR